MLFFSLSSKARLVVMVVAALVLCCCNVVDAHSRLGYPTARSTSSGIKDGPCGSQNNVFDLDAVLEISPGPLTITIEEAIRHDGAPWRISLSQDGSDDGDACLILDHLPWNLNTVSNPTYGDDSTWLQHYITVVIPDVQCDACSIHLANPMTDKLSGTDESASGIGCTDPDGTCASVYHSCSVPLRINGTVPRAELTDCGQPADWPTTFTSAYNTAETVNVETLGVYRSEGSYWEDGWLTEASGVPEFYRSPVNETEEYIFPEEDDHANSTDITDNDDDDTTPTGSPGATVSPTVLTTLGLMLCSLLFTQQQQQQA